MADAGGAVAAAMETMTAELNWLDLLYWVVVIAIVAALLSIALYCLFKVTDLMEDSLNPYDASKQLNTGAWRPTRDGRRLPTQWRRRRRHPAASSPRGHNCDRTWPCLLRSGEAGVLPAGHVRHYFADAATCCAPPPTCLQRDSGDDMSTTS